MKKWTLIPKLALALVALCTGFLSPAQDNRLSHVPNTASLVVKLYFRCLDSSPAFKALVDSGMLGSIHDDMTQIPWTGNKELPDPVIFYAQEKGPGWVMLVETDKKPQELVETMSELFGDQQSVEHYAIGDTITIKRLSTDKKNGKPVKTKSRIVYLTKTVLVFGPKNGPVSYDFSANPTIPAVELAGLETAGRNVVAAGIMRSFPVPASDDMTGLSALVKTGMFTISEQESGEVSLSLNFECKGEKEAGLTARRLRSFVRIALVSLFATDKDLVKELNNTFETANEGDKASLEIRLPAVTVDKVLAFYGIIPQRKAPMAVPPSEREVAQK